jgi:hypothetical protein
MHEVARRLVHAVRHQHVVAGLQVRQQHHADGRQARGKEPRAVRAFELADRVFEREGGGRAACAVAEDALVAAAGACSRMAPTLSNSTVLARTSGGLTGTPPA